jgi:hypothetical protein
LAGSLGRSCPSKTGRHLHHVSHARRPLCELANQQPPRGRLGLRRLPLGIEVELAQPSCRARAPVGGDQFVARNPLYRWTGSSAGCSCRSKSGEGERGFSDDPARRAEGSRLVPQTPGIRQAG